MPLIAYVPDYLQSTHSLLPSIYHFNDSRMAISLKTGTQAICRWTLTHRDQAPPAGRHPRACFPLAPRSSPCQTANFPITLQLRAGVSFEFHAQS